MIIDIAPEVWVETHQVAAVTEITLQGRSQTPSHIRYAMELIRQGRAGSARTGQSGRALLPSGEQKTMAKVAVVLQPSDHWELRVEVQANGGTNRTHRYAGAIDSQSVVTLTEMTDVEAP